MSFDYLNELTSQFVRRALSGVDPIPLAQNLLLKIIPMRKVDLIEKGHVATSVNMIRQLSRHPSVDSRVGNEYFQ